ncbi:channel protein hemolysin III family subfamily YqfA [Shewanella gelidii]|uniref:Channel protein hemolysin III family subfamily YqfA n=2 Tax=Shewanella gelidii TaxID=1642821 RepID=A0A917NAZ7_9GAMM|nr:channel protein hemolysin III family subfamily YqfA [Shewanella gelidii]
MHPSMNAQLAEKTEAPVYNTAKYSLKEELANTLTHALGTVMGVIGLIAMLTKGWPQLSSIQITGVTLYGASIILLFLCSTLYHGVQSPYLKKQLKVADHCAIFLLIAGTYTPLVLISLQHADVNWVLISIWLLALGGIIFKVFFTGRFQWLSLSLYLLMGWLCMFVVDDLVTSLNQLGFNLLLSGGLLYSLGIIFYVGKKIPYNHAIWHLFVLGGAFCHFFCIYLAVL